jgi:hypothetical protein
MQLCLRCLGDCIRTTHKQEARGFCSPPERCLMQQSQSSLVLGTCIRAALERLARDLCSPTE